MKRCPECRRDYYDDTLLYCLDDGNALLEGPASADEPATAILSEPAAVQTGFPPSESPTVQLQTPGTASSRGRSKRKLLAAATIAFVLVIGGIGYAVYKFWPRTDKPLQA